MISQVNMGAKYPIVPLYFSNFRYIHRQHRVQYSYTCSRVKANNFDQSIISGNNFLFYPTSAVTQSYAASGGGGRAEEEVDSSNSTSRPLANFQSTVWGNHFLSYSSQLTEITMQEKLEHEEFKEKVRKMLVETPDNTPQKLVLIDAIQRLGVAYHFRNEIETSVQNIFELQRDENENANLDVVALRFRLVRQQGHYISSDVFKQFTNKDGTFKETLCNDVQAILSLYEAAHLVVHGEKILEEALTFSTTRLEFMIPNLCNSLKVQVTEALSLPIRKSLPRVGARSYIFIYENIEDHNVILLKFAKLDFNMLQKLHQEELNELTGWWIGFDFVNKLPYARDRVVEAYLWALGIYFEPKYSSGRKILTKVAKMNSIIDDTYDAYATFDEIVLLNEAIQRWDIGAMDSLPPYQKPIYQALLDTYDEMDQILTKAGKPYGVHYAKHEMKKMVTAYFKEAEWLNAGYIPTCEEYMKNGLPGSSIMVYGTTSLVAMEEVITKETLEWMANEPLIVRASSAICRLMDDAIDHQAEYAASFVECYMKEYGASKEEAYAEIRKEVTNAWKDINSELLRLKEVPTFVLERALNLVRLSYTFFKDEDGYTNPNSKFRDLITLLFVESVK